MSRSNNFIKDIYSKDIIKNMYSNMYQEIHNGMSPENLCLNLSTNNHLFTAKEIETKRCKYNNNICHGELLLVKINCAPDAEIGVYSQAKVTIYDKNKIIYECFGTVFTDPQYNKSVNKTIFPSTAGIVEFYIKYPPLPINILCNLDRFETMSLLSFFIKSTKKKEDIETIAHLFEISKD